MKDPYSILGVSPNATDDEVKAAYRELAKKYHPDHYGDNPLSDLAEDKMQEINQAYDQIMNARRGRKRGRGGSAGYQQAASSNYPDIRSMITSNRLEEAQELLDGVPIAKRDAEWYFLCGTIQYKRGWFDNAYTNFSTACRMDPGNMEYRAAFNQMQRRANGGFARQPGQGGCSACDMCSTLICADCCCECMGGDLIRCC